MPQALRVEPSGRNPERVYPREPIPSSTRTFLEFQEAIAVKINALNKNLNVFYLTSLLCLRSD